MEVEIQYLQKLKKKIMELCVKKKETKQLEG